MLGLCRRGPASLGRLACAVESTHLSAIRTSVCAASIQSLSSPTAAVRTIHTSLALSARGGSGRGSYSRGPRTPRYDEFDAATLEPVQYTPEITRFQELADNGLVPSILIDNITRGFGHSTMTEVQAMTITQTLDGKDALAQAKTGTGKTLGFLVPIITRMLKANPELDWQGGAGYKARSDHIKAIIISPTRELAEQIAVEAKKLTKGTRIETHVAVGGTGKRDMIREMKRYGCHLLVATPGRLQDLLSDEWSGVSAPDLQALVLDEADRLLDDGFSAAIQDIMDVLPLREEVDRQTLLFSATVPREVMRLVRSTLKPDFHFVQAVKDGEVATHEKVPQHLVHCKGMENTTPALMELCKREMQKSQADMDAGVPGAKPFKAIVYYSNLGMVELAGDIFTSLKQGGSNAFAKHPLAPAEISVIHSKLSQQERQRVSDRFRRSKFGIMFSSDVTARGLDFPNVTHVIQMGMPPTKEQYIHRVGRTGRGDNAGEGYLILPDWEIPLARRMLTKIPLIPNDTLRAAKVDMTRSAQLPADLANIFIQVGDATKTVDKFIKADAFRALLSSASRSSDRAAAVEQLVNWTKYGWGWERPPTISSSMASMMGLPKDSPIVASRPTTVARPSASSSRF